MTTTRVRHAITVFDEESPQRVWKVAVCSCGWRGPCCGTTKKALDHADRNHSQTRCPTPHKEPHDTRRDAELTLLRFWSTAPSWKKQPTRVYSCECGRWHTTSKPPLLRENN